MNVYIAKHSGFCKGVEHAINTALSLEASGAYILGEIIHNDVVIGTIRDKGLKVVESLAQVPDGGTVVFRSHGVPQSFYEQCALRNVKIIDCTCGFVKRTQKIVAEQSAQGNFVVIAGETTHPEVVGLLGWCKENALVVSDENADLSALADKNVCIVSQTTFSTLKFEKIIKNIKKVCEKTVAVFKTICYTTIERQFETEKLAKTCEAMLVVGGLNSSNTNKLYDIASRYCANVFRLANSDDMDYSKLNKFKSVGIVSGASTPNAQTREVLLKMEENTEVKVTDSMADVVAKIDSESKFKKGQIVQATISQATDDGLQILLAFSKKEIALSKDELDCEHYSKADYESRIGDTIDLLVVELKPALKLSQKMIRLLKEEETLSVDLEAGKEFTAVCTGTNKGGLVAQLGTYSVFVPAKEIRLGFVKDLSKFVGKTLRLRALDIRKTGRKEIVASQRIIMQEEHDARVEAKTAKEEAFFDSISVGDIVEGKVERAAEFGAFVSVNGFDCLAHLSDLSWTGVEAVQDVLEIGKVYKFKVMKVDRNKKKVSIGYKQLQPQPWDLADGKYSVDDVVHGKVVRLVPFGAFIEVEKGIDGLVHVSQISHERVETPASVLNVGDEVDAKIISLDISARKMNLSIKALQPEPERVPRPRKQSGEGDDGRKSKARFTRKSNSDDELSNWSEGGIAGTSIADLLASAKNHK